jgi:hypothetical protein
MTTMPRRWCTVAWLLLPLWLGSSAFALDWRFGGFGTAGVSCFTGDDADFAANFQPVGPGRSGVCDAGLDSIIGGQLDLKLLEGLEVGVQGTAERDVEKDFAPQLSVAQLRWKPVDGLTLRFGRSPTPAFLYSESRRVRYAMPWVRPPREVYGLVPLLTGDGAEAIYQSRLGTWLAEWHTGITASDIGRPPERDMDNLSVSSVQGFVNLTLKGGHGLVKASYLHGRVSIESQSLDIFFSLLRNPLLFSDGAGVRLARDLNSKDSPYHFLGIGARYERDDWLALGEFGYITMDNFMRDRYGIYFTLGRQLGPWMPYGTVARRWSEGPDSDPRAGVLRPAVEAILASSRSDGTSVAVGLSREVTDHATLKFQVDWMQPDARSWGLYAHHGPGYDYAHPPGDLLFTLNLDFVF